MSQQAQQQAPQPNDASFPSTDDLCNLSMDDARRALHALRTFVDNDLARVSDLAQPRHLLAHDAAHSSLQHEWYVYLAITQRHLPLAAWANEWLADQDRLGHTEMQDQPRFTPGQVVRWRDGRCTIRLDGISTRSERYRTRFCSGPILSGENAGGYAMSVPEEQLEEITPQPPTSGGDAA